MHVLTILIQGILPNKITLVIPTSVKRTRAFFSA